MFGQIVGKNISKRRKGKNMSILNLALETGLDLANLSRIECGKANPTLQKLRKISRALGCTLYDLFEEPDGSHATADRFIMRRMSLSPLLQKAFPDPLLVLSLYDTDLLDKHTVKDIAAENDKPLP
ncbi:helix-turn-helix domain-containing protein [Intestinibacillus massiliensis]|uniref:helix-turn-helix domain-containing protein n=1 Tax=Intestinibacillus massiliensis TaxID=1871029 RepID=UPI0013566495|nr:helix-turn-helix transcriptional regulator [Intestinibacillus massiliensis]